jgi:hypothetical protein
MNPLKILGLDIGKHMHRYLRLCRTGNRDVFPPLARFERDWGIRIPLDLAIPFLPDFVALQILPRDYEVTITLPISDAELIVEFRIRPEASKEVLLAQFDAVLQTYHSWNFNPKALLDTLQQMYRSWNIDPQAPRARQRQELAYYDTMFRAYDLRQQGQSRPKS